MAVVKTERISETFQQSAQVKLQFAKQYDTMIAEVAKRWVSALKKGHKLLFFGNGGSACDATHLAAELVNRFNRNRPALAAISLATDTAALTSISNDFDYADIFARQLEALGQKGDIAVAISTSGNSPNILKAVEAAKTRGLLTVAFTGKDGGKLAPMADYAFIVPSESTPRIQETHITLGHLLCELVEEEMYG
jgi:D-sedoheptulose 7-phosphate isomerase